MSESLFEGIIPPEQPAIKVGLASLGLGTPAARFVAGTALGVVLVWALRPQIAFTPDGQAKPLTLLVPPEQESTPLPWYFLALIPGAIAGTFL